jgi:uncharacterized protein YcbK (DUF882 family)
VHSHAASRKAGGRTVVQEDPARRAHAKFKQGKDELRQQGASPARLPSHLALAALSAVLLASCSTTSEPMLAVALQPPPPSLAATAPATAVDQAGITADTDTIAGAQATTAYSFVGDGDPVLPQKVAAVPSPAPLQVASAATATGDRLTQSQIDAVIDSRAGPAEPAADAAQNGAQPAALPEPAPAPQKKRGFFASLFGTGEQAAAPRPVVAASFQPASQPQQQVASIAAPATATAPAPAVHPATAASATSEPAAIAEKMAAATTFIENRPPEAAAATSFVEPKKRGFFASLFTPAEAAPAPQRRVVPQPAVQAAAAPLVQLASTGPVVELASTEPRSLATSTALPGVRTDNLFEISRKSGTGDDSDIDLHEDDEVEVASAAGLARLAPNGLITQTDRVDVHCLKPSLVRVIKTIEGHYGRKVIVTSGYRSPPNNRRARGARNSLHMYCAAADIQVEGVTKWELATYLRSMPGRGGVGTYCYTNSVHVDVGPERDWDWRCRRRKK